jgi:hypothetical protein
MVEVTIMKLYKTCVVSEEYIYAIDSRTVV